MTKKKFSSKKRAIDAALERIRTNRSDNHNAIEIANGIINGKLEELARGITLIESERLSDRPLAQLLLQEIKSFIEEKSHYSQIDTVRIGITGIPGVGKSTFIERLGLDLIKEGHRVAVLAVDPSSKRTGGSILGDKTRMDELAVQENAFIRPSPASDALGGVARATMEAVILCEAAGYNRIIVETVGVGQSETAVREMVDVFCLLLIGGAGDEVQGIKRGIVEMADLIIVHKSDGDNIAACASTAQAYINALHLFPPPPSGEKVDVLLASSIDGSGHSQIREEIDSLTKLWKESGWWSKQRANQNSDRMTTHARDLLLAQKMDNPKSALLWNKLQLEVTRGTRSAFSAAWDWVNSDSDK
ncbi:MAG: methylmalonyl Co-A mutase-associated GTPase MeaB [Bacteroidetes bacterium]|nr:MAG: methylmalonyl Co-A mutase-associated GTPase MeaB [Bacteroidota bacterium]